MRRGLQAAFPGRPIATLAAAVLIQAADLGPVSAGNRCADVGPSRAAICVCNKSRCWIEPGTRYRFDALFSEARALTDAGAIGVWKPAGMRRHQSPRLR